MDSHSLMRLRLIARVCAHHFNRVWLELFWSIEQHLFLSSTLHLTCIRYFLGIIRGQLVFACVAVPILLQGFTLCVVEIGVDVFFKYYLSDKNKMNVRFHEAFSDYHRHCKFQPTYIDFIAANIIKYILHFFN